MPKMSFQHYIMLCFVPGSSLCLHSYWNVCVTFCLKLHVIVMSIYLYNKHINVLIHINTQFENKIGWWFEEKITWNDKKNKKTLKERNVALLLATSDVHGLWRVNLFEHSNMHHLVLHCKLNTTNKCIYLPVD